MESGKQAADYIVPVKGEKDRDKIPWIQPPDKGIRHL